jgi:hypothetical protein
LVLGGWWLIFVLSRATVALEIIVLMVMAKDFYLDAAGSERPSFNDKENRCKQVFQRAVSQYGGFWHLCTPGDGQALVF